MAAMTDAGNAMEDGAGELHATRSAAANMLMTARDRRRVPAGDFEE